MLELEVVRIGSSRLRCNVFAASLALAWLNASCGPPVVVKKHTDSDERAKDAGTKQDAGARDDASAPDADDTHDDARGGRGGSNAGASGSGGVGGAQATSNTAGSMAAGSAASGGGGARAAGAGGAAGAATPSGPLTWSAPALIETSTVDAHSPYLARNRAGDVVVSWWQDDPDGYIWMKRFINGAWDTDTFRSKGATNPGTFNWTQFAGIDRDGAVQLFWLGSTKEAMGTAARVYWVRWAGEASIPLETAPLVLGDQGVGLPIGLSVTEAGLGTAAWVSIPDTTANTQTMYMNTRSAGGWATPVMIQSLEPLSNAKYFWTATDGDGGFATSIIYNDQDSAKAFRSVHTFMAQDSVVTVPAPIEVPEPVGYVDLEYDTGGNATALITTIPDSLIRHLYGSRYSASSKLWTTPELLSKQLVSGEDLTLLPGGQPFAVWFESTKITESSSVGHFVTSHYDVANQRWAEPEKISDDCTLMKGGTWSSANSAGSIVVVWAQGDASDSTAIYYARFTKADGWSKPALLAPYSGELSIFGLTLAEDGHALVVWQQADPGSRVHDLKWSRSR